MRIHACDLYPTRIPIYKTSYLGSGDLVEIENVLIRVTTEDGVVGWGESSPWAMFGQTQSDVVAALQKYLIPAVLNEKVSDIELILRKMDRVLAGHSYAKAGLEIALWDALAKSWGQPLYNLLGGCYRNKIPLGHSIANANASEDIAQIERLYSEGLRIFKIKTGALSPKEDLERVKQICKMLPSDGDVRVDYNQNLPWENALTVLRGLEELDLTFVEQPLARWNLDGMARLTAATHLPIMADESVFSVHDAIEIVRRHAADILSIKVMKHGGLFRSKQIIAIAEAAGIPCHAGLMWESGIGLAASIHLAASSPNMKYGSDFYIPYWLMENHLLVRLPDREGSHVSVPHEPGLGVTVDEDALQAYCISL
jgi:muconate cycloisomerase